MMTPAQQWFYDLVRRADPARCRVVVYTLHQHHVFRCGETVQLTFQTGYEPPE